MKDLLQLIRKSKTTKSGIVVLAVGFIISLCAAWTYTWDITTPAGTDPPSVIDDRIQETKAAVQERLNVDHYFPLTGSQVSDADAGYHRAIHFRSTTGEDPILGFVTVGGVDELRYTDSGSNAVIFTSAGTFNIALLTSKTIETPTLTSPVLNTGVSGTAVLDEDNMASDSNSKLATQQSIKAYVDAQLLAAIQFSAYTTQDSDNNTMLKSHAYKAQTAGFVTAYVSNQNAKILRGYVGLTSDPVGGGLLVQTTCDLEGSSATSISFPVAKDEYFEITYDGTNTPTIRWKSVGTLLNPIDYD